MLFKTKEEFRAHVETGAELSLDALKSSIMEAVNTYIIPAIGEAFYLELMTAHQLGGATQAQQDAIHYLQAALAPYAVVLAAPKNMVSFGNAGLTEFSSGNETQTRQWVLFQYMKAQLRAGDTALDFALAFLEANKTNYPTWANSESFTITKELFFQNIFQLGEWVNVVKGRRTYLALKPFIRRAERQYIRKLIGDDLYRELKAEQKAGTLSEDNAELIAEYIRPALGPLSLAMALPEISLEMSEDGIRFKSFDNGITKREGATNEDKSMLFRSVDTNGEAELAGLKNYLLKNAESFPAFLTSKTYLDRQGGSGPSFCAGGKHVIV